MDGLALDQLTGFLNRYRSFTDQLNATRLEQFRFDFGRIKAELTRLRTEADEQDRLVASRFNVFRLLGVADAEVTTHSALLADLLDPQGSHAQGHLFLDRFLKACKAKFAGFPVPAGELTSSRWVVEKEKATSWGNLDLVVSCRSLGYLLVIENKIWAVEQPEQLKRYYEWMQGRRDRFLDQVLIYLTPRGVESHTGAGCPYFPLSYRDNLKAWLEASLAEVRAPRVRETLVQYLEVISAF